MTPDTAKSILRKELAQAEQQQQELSVDFMGGEPLLNFSLIRDVCEWLWTQPNARRCNTFARTNGLLLNDEIMQWCRRNRERFILGLSLDGLPEMNGINRDKKYPNLAFFRELWPEQPIKMTLFPSSIHLLAESVIHFHENNIPMSVSTGDGFPWQDRALDILRDQLEKLLAYYLEHPGIRPVEPLLDQSFLGCIESSDLIPSTMPLCGEATGLITYDCDGTAYRCHMFSPVVLGEKRAREAKERFANLNEVPLDPQCSQCPARAVCKQCFGLNFRDFNDLSHSASRHYACALHKLLYTYQARLFAEKLTQQIAQGYTPHASELQDAKKALYVLSCFS